MSLGQPQTDPNPPFLTVEMTTGPSSPVVAKYRARTVAVDGYLDLAVVQIYATASGKPVSPGSLHLPYYTLGNVAALQLDQNVTTLGFPGMSGSDSITVTSGVVDTFVPDPLKHVKDPRFELETTAKIGHGNSGGAAINNAGQLIGVPSLGVPGQGGDVSWRLRSVAEAKPLIAAARNHTAYHSKILVQMTGTESVSQVGVGTDQEACSGNRTATASASATFGFSYAGFPKGLDVALYIGTPDGGHWVTDAAGTLPQSTSDKDGCLSYTLDAAALGQDTMPVGTYQLQLLAGPSLTPTPTGPRLAAGVAPLVQLLPGDIGDPTTQCQNDPPPYSWDMPGRVAALACTEPGLPKGKLYAYQMDSQADYEATWQSYSKVAGFTGASPGQDCPPAKGGVGTFPTDSKMFPHRSGQVLWCVMVDVGNGPQPTYTWTLPSEDAFFVAAGAPKSSFAALDKWWSNNSLPMTAPSPSAS